MAFMTVTEKEGDCHRGDSNYGKRDDEYDRGGLTKRGSREKERKGELQREREKERKGELQREKEKRES